MAGAQNYIGIDVGTSGVKALLMDGAGVALADATAPLAISRPRPGWSEQDPADWWTATRSALDGLSRSRPAETAAVVGIGLSGQMHGATLLDADNNVLRPAILWNDGRSGAQCAQIEQACPASRAITGNIAMPGFTAPKVLWVKEHEREIYDRIARVLLPKDYVRFLLTGEYFCDMSDASGTLWLDVGRRAWSNELLAVTGLNQTHMPALVEGEEPAGTLKRELASRWGMTGPVVVAGGGGDNAASGCGIGAVRAGQGFVSLGTSGVLFVCNDRFRPNTQDAVHALCHAISGTWHQSGVILSATDSLNWLAGLTGNDAASLAGRVEAGFTGPANEIFLPYLSGERTPHANAAARGSFVGLSHLSDPVTLAQAVMEAIAFAFRDCQQVFAKAGTEISRLFAVGGGSNSDLWLKMLATNLDMEIHVPQVSKFGGDFGGAFGAARLGLCAATGADPLVVCTAPEIRKTIAPDPALKNAYGDQYARYRALYPAIEKARA
ncbi:MAG: xylulokinase [Alphaproteobacteria bacterium]|nr:xylulokinase [Alphaproteobacteria bacterium]